MRPVGSAVMGGDTGDETPERRRSVASGPMVGPGKRYRRHWTRQRPIARSHLAHRWAYRRQSWATVNASPLTANRGGGTPHLCEAGWPGPRTFRAGHATRSFTARNAKKATWPAAGASVVGAKVEVRLGAGQPATNMWRNRKGVTG